MKRTVTLILLALLAFTITLGGCTNNSGAEETDSPPPVADNPSPSGTPVHGGEIIVGIAQDLGSSFDPHQMAAAGTAGLREVLFNVFEGLVRPTPDGELVPAIAESFSVDGTVYTFTLRDGVRFHNGDLVTVEDVVYSIARSADAEQASTFVAAFSVIHRVEAIDDRTVEIEIEAPDNAFLALLTIAIIPADYDDQAQNPIGTGPFQFVSHTPQDNLVLRRFDDYWGQPAYLEQVTFRIFGSGDAMAMALSAGAVDIAGQLTSDMVRQIPDDFYYLAGPMNLVQALWLNNAVPPLDNVYARYALAWAIDVDEIIALLYDGEGFPIGSSMPPSFTRYFHEDLVNTFTDQAGEGVDTRSVALDMLELAGLPDGFDLTITVPGNQTPHVLTAEIIAEQLRAVNINVTIDLVEWAWWLSEVNSGRNFQSTITGIAARDITARSFMERWVSDNSRNFINFYSPEYDAIFTEAQNTTDETEQARLYRELQEIVTNEAGSVFLQDLVNFVGINGNLSGWQFYSIYVMDLATVHFTE